MREQDVANQYLTPYISSGAQKKHSHGLDGCLWYPQTFLKIFQSVTFTSKPSAPAFLQNQLPPLPICIQIHVSCLFLDAKYCVDLNNIYILVCEFKYLFLTQSINFSMTCYYLINKSWLSLQWTFSPVENLLRQAYHLSPYIYPKRHSNSAPHLCAPHNVRHRQIGCKYRNGLQCKKIK